MGTLFRTFLSTLIRHGHLEVQTADGITQVFGDRTGPKLGVRLADRAAERALTFDPTLAMGELYMDGRLIVTKGDLYDVLALGEQNILAFGGPRWLKLLEDARIATRRFRQRNDRLHAKQNIAHHYDLNVRLYDLFLDADRQYSCAYFEHPGATLEEAQLAKKRHIAAKLLVEDSHSVLDIGCGFGGMGLYLAGAAGARATGVTLSREQHGVAVKRAIDGGLADRASFHLQDYRDVTERFDRIVSVGMFEHVGVGGYRRVLPARPASAEGRRRDAAARDRAQRQAQRDQPVDRQVYLSRRLHPQPFRSVRVDRARGAVCDRHRNPAASLRRDAEESGASVSWPTAKRPGRCTTSVSAGCGNSISRDRKTSFRVDGNMVFQIQLAKNQNVVPATRNYVAAREARLREREQQKPRAAAGGRVNRRPRTVGARTVGEATMPNDPVFDVEDAPNQSPPFVDRNLFLEDCALRDGAAAAGVDAAARDAGRVRRGLRRRRGDGARPARQ